MENTITVRITTVYGKKSVYPVCQVAHYLAKLTGTKTFNDSQIQTIKDLGYEIAVEAQSI